MPKLKLKADCCRAPQWTRHDTHKTQINSMELTQSNNITNFDFGVNCHFKGSINQ